MKRLLAVLLMVLVLAVSGYVVGWRQKLFPPQSLDGNHVLAETDPLEDSAPVAADLTRKPLDRIPVGTVIGTKPPTGWSHLVLPGHPNPDSGGPEGCPGRGGVLC